MKTIKSPDGTFRVDCVPVPDAGAGDWETTRVVALPGEREVMHLPLFKVIGMVQFPGPGMVKLPLQHRDGQRHLIVVNVAAGTFTLQTDGQEKPVELLLSRITPKTVPVKEALIQPSWETPRQKIGSVAGLAVSLLFMSLGIWLSIEASTPSDRWIGLACVLFFAICAAIPIVSLIKRRRQTNSSQT